MGCVRQLRAAGGVVICPPCRARDHEGCPEIARQKDLDLSVTDKVGSALCDCQHQSGSYLLPEGRV